MAAQKKVSLVLLGMTMGCVLLSMIPMSDIWLYPVKLFVTYVHELCHAAAAILTGGTVYSIVIHPDESGVTMTSGGIQWLINSAGYLGTAFLGALCLKALKSFREVAKPLLVFFSGVMIWALFFIGTNSAFSTVWGLIIAVSIFTIAISVSRGVVFFVSSFISIQLLINAFYDLKVLFDLSGTGVATDALNMQHETGVPAIVWACTWIAISALATYRILFK